MVVILNSTQTNSSKILFIMYVSFVAQYCMYCFSLNKKKLAMYIISWFPFESFKIL